MLIMHLLPSVFWALFILVLYGLPGGDLPSLDWMALLSFDKLAHAVFFAVQVCTLIVAFRKQHTYDTLRKKAFVWAVGIGSLYGVVLEALQNLLFIDRTTDWMDLLANLIGCGLGVILFRVIYGKELAFLK